MTNNSDGFDLSTVIGRNISIDKLMYFYFMNFTTKNTWSIFEQFFQPSGETVVIV